MCHNRLKWTWKKYPVKSVHDYVESAHCGSFIVWNLNYFFYIRKVVSARKFRWIDWFYQLIEFAKQSTRAWHAPCFKNLTEQPCHSKKQLETFWPSFKTAKDTFIIVFCQLLCLTTAMFKTFGKKKFTSIKTDARKPQTRHIFICFAKFCNIILFNNVLGSNRKCKAHLSHVSLEKVNRSLIKKVKHTPRTLLFVITKNLCWALDCKFDLFIDLLG